VRDAQLAYELQTSPKELAELLMITDLLRNDLGRICDFGSIHVPELTRLEKFPQVQHLVATIEGRLLPKLSHVEAVARCFPGGSVTGAPKIRAMEIIDELEPTARGPYTGALGYLGFNGESQLSIVIRTAITAQGKAWFHTGAGIVADSCPEAEFAETTAKAAGFLLAIASRPDHPKPAGSSPLTATASA
jgi:anthranilate/para-aminobenzoate synthase component I